MSNHHPGNEWYRRLIRSNRPLYRACPKHTKLLVSKAIVQAVEQQGGRFLEKSKVTGYWCTVAYKRAVDKTSQGLREREREEDMPGHPSSTMANQPPEPRHPEGIVPASWTAAVRGRNNSGPDLNDLAVVAVAQAGLPNKGIGAGTPPNPPALKRPIDAVAAPQQADKRPKNMMDPSQQQALASHQMNAQMNARSLSHRGPQTSSMFGMPQFPRSNHMQQNQQQQQHLQHQRPVWSGHAQAAPPPPPAPNTARGNPIVLPTQLTNLQPEKNKLPLKVPPRKKKGQTKAQELAVMVGEPVLPLPQQMKKPPQTHMAPGQLPQQYPYPQQRQQHAPYPGQYRGGPSILPHDMYPPPFAPIPSFGLMPPGYGPNTSVYGAPPPADYSGGTDPKGGGPPPQPGSNGAPLSRLTSQVSDWLNSFWPLQPPGQGSAMHSQRCMTMPPQLLQQQYQQQQQQQQHMHMPPGMSPGILHAGSIALPPQGDPSRQNAVEIATAATTLIPPPQPKGSQASGSVSGSVSGSGTESGTGSESASGTALPQQQQQHMQHYMMPHEIARHRQDQLVMQEQQLTIQHQQKQLEMQQTQLAMQQQRVSMQVAPIHPSTQVQLYVQQQSVNGKKCAKKMVPAPPPIVTIPPPDPAPAVKITIPAVNARTDKVNNPSAPVSVRTDNRMDTPALAMSRTDKLKSPPAPSTVRTDKRKNAPAVVMSRTDKVNDPSAPVTVRTDTRKNAPSLATSRIDKHKSPPAPAAVWTDRRNIVPALATSRADKHKHPPAPASVRTDKRKSRSVLPQLPYGAPVSENYLAVSPTAGGTNFDATAVAERPPEDTSPYTNDEEELNAAVSTGDDQTELEQSVSTTLLALASAPSKLFSGLTSLFSTDGNSDFGMATAAAKLDDAPSPPVASAGSTQTQATAGKPSLLDDYEESPMEARLRTVRWS
jgi:hypothetical protein